MDIHEQIAVKIIESQEAIIGPVALEQAKQVNGLKVDWDNRSVAISGDNLAVIDDLIEQYKELFGHISVEVSKQAAGSLMLQLSAEQMPQTLR